MRVSRIEVKYDLARAASFTLELTAGVSSVPEKPVDTERGWFAPARTERYMM